MLLAALLAALLGAGANAQSTPKQEPPPETELIARGRALVRIRFEGDYLALERLLERHKVTVRRHHPPDLVLEIDLRTLPALLRDDLQPELVDPLDFFEQHVRIDGPDDRQIETVRRIGGELVTREPKHVVFRLTLRQLELVKQAKIEVRPIRPGDLVPRFIEVRAPTEAEVRLVVSAGVDIFEAEGDVFLGRAYDGQIEHLRRHGLDVEVVPPPGAKKP